MFSIKQKTVILLCFLMLFNFLVVIAQPATPPPSGYHWELKWEDNFDGTTLDTKKWTTNYHWGQTDALGGEVRYDNYIHPNQVNVHDGILSLKNSENIFPADYPSSNNGEYRLMNRSNSKYITPINASTNFSVSIVQEDYGSFTKAEAAEWKLQSLGNNTYSIKNKNSASCLTHTATGVTQKYCSSTSDDQKWILTEVSNGWYNIQNVGSQMYLSQNGTEVTEASYEVSNKSIQWKLFCKLQWNAGVVQNLNKISINRPGYVEASMKMPASTGVWPAFWLVGNGWPPEVDILEYLSSKTDDGGKTVYTAVSKDVHFKDATVSPAVNKSSVSGDKTPVNPRDFDSKFNTFGMYMGSATPTGTINQFRWYLNSGQSHSWGGTASFGQFANLYAILSAGNGGWAGFPNAKSVFPNDFDVDWFRYWELVPGCATPVITPYSQINGGAWSTDISLTTVNIKSGDKVVLGPQPFEGSWSWSGCDATGILREITINPTQSCVITATNTNSCGGSSSVNFNIIVDDKPLSLETISKEKEFNIYPNPATKIVNLRLPKFYENNALITIVNSFGQTVLSKTNNNESMHVLDVSNLSSGVYFIKISNKEATTTKKFIKQ